MTVLIIVLAFHLIGFALVIMTHGDRLTLTDVVVAFILGGTLLLHAIIDWTFVGVTGVVRRAL
jgi:hypothetical protein